MMQMRRLFTFGRISREHGLYDMTHTTASDPIDNADGYTDVLGVIDYTFTRAKFHIFATGSPVPIARSFRLQ